MKVGDIVYVFPKPFLLQIVSTGLETRISCSPLDRGTVEKKTPTTVELKLDRGYICSKCAITDVYETKAAALDAYKLKLQDIPDAVISALSPII